MQPRSLSPSYFRELCTLAAGGGGSAVPHPAGGSTLTALPCGGFEVKYDPAVAEGKASFRLLTNNFVLGLINLTPRQAFQYDFSNVADSNAAMIFIALSSAAPTPWEDQILPDASGAPQTVACTLSSFRHQSPRARVGARVRAITMATMDDDKLGEFEPSLELIDYFGTSAEAAGVNVRIAATDKAVIQAARQMFSNPFTGDVLEAYLRAKAVEILCLMRNSLERPAPVRESDTIQEACALIDDMLAEPLDIGAIAEATHLSVRSLVRKFKAETGMTLGQYQRSKRLALAANLLLTTRLPVTRIAGDVGFSETASFSRAFAQHFSLSPSEFRRLAQA